MERKRVTPPRATLAPPSPPAPKPAAAPPAAPKPTVFGVVLLTLIGLAVCAAAVAFVVVWAVNGLIALGVFVALLFTFGRGRRGF